MKKLISVFICFLLLFSVLVISSSASPYLESWKVDFTKGTVSNSSNLSVTRTVSSIKVTNTKNIHSGIDFSSLVSGSYGLGRDYVMTFDLSSIGNTQVIIYLSKVKENPTEKDIQLLYDGSFSTISHDVNVKFTNSIGSPAYLFITQMANSGATSIISDMEFTLYNPNATLESQQAEQNSKLDEQNSKLDEQNSILNKEYEDITVTDIDMSNYLTDIENVSDFILEIQKNFENSEKVFNALSFFAFVWDGCFNYYGDIESKLLFLISFAVLMTILVHILPMFRKNGG